MRTVKRTGVLGGTFDPIHVGHLDLALVARQVLQLDEVLFMPARVPPHRAEGPYVSAYHRFAMVALATAPYDAFQVCDLELRAPGPSYTSVTLEHLALAGRDAASLFFVLGVDAFAEITTWHDYPGVLERSHFLVISRPGSPVAGLGTRLPALSNRMHEVSAGTDLPAVGPGRPLEILLVDAATRDVSSTEVRRRLAAGESVADLVPAGVGVYIARHRLYASRQSGHQLA